MLRPSLRNKSIRVSPRWTPHSLFPPSCRPPKVPSLCELWDAVHTPFVHELFPDQVRDGKPEQCRQVILSPTSVLSYVSLPRTYTYAVLRQRAQDSSLSPPTTALCNFFFSVCLVEVFNILLALFPDVPKAVVSNILLLCYQQVHDWHIDTVNLVCSFYILYLSDCAYEI